MTITEYIGANTVGITGPTGLSPKHGNLIQVDSVYGSDSLGASEPYRNPFKTITSALTHAYSGQTVQVLPGNYSETITIPSGVSVRGASTQTTILGITGATGPTTMVTMGTQTRLEDMTITLESPNNVNLVGIHFPGATPTNSKVRTCVANVTYDGPTGSNNVFGVLADGTSINPNTYASLDSIRSSTINVNVPNSGCTGCNIRGVYVSNACRFSARDTNIYTNGPTGIAGSNVSIGVETSNASAFTQIKAGTIYGTTQDIARTAGTLLISFTDLINYNAGATSFSVGTEPNTVNFGFIGNPATNTTYYLAPGTLPIASLPTGVFQIPFAQNQILFAGTIYFSGTLGTASITLNVYKNGGASPVFSISLTDSQKFNTNNGMSVSFSTSDYYDVRVVTVGNPGTGNFNSALSFY